jgi:AbrB family looped-hinge helix DNA binding protein
MYYKNKLYQYKIIRIMKAIKTKLGKNGRVFIPTAFRQNLHLETGDDIILHIVDNIIHITTIEQSLHQLQNKVKNYIDATKGEISLTEELISTRRKEAINE